MRITKPLVDRFWARVAKDDDHWLWTGAVGPKGHGIISRGRRGEGLASVHRLSYEIHYGPIPEGAVIRHTCDVAACVKPEHLITGTVADNNQDMSDRGRAWWQTRKFEACPHGHPYDDDNLYFDSQGRRRCRSCRKRMRRGHKERTGKWS